MNVDNRLEILWNHHNYQIEENRKISRRIDELEEVLIKLVEKVTYLSRFLDIE